MATANDLVSRAARRANILASGQVLDGNDAEDALVLMDSILDQWNLEDLMVFYTSILEFPLVDGTESYTIGPDTGDFTAARPIEILGAGILDAQDLFTPISVVAYDTYEQNTQKHFTPGGMPTQLAYNPTPVNGTLYLWQTPMAGLTLRLQVAGHFSGVTDLAQELILSPGCEKAIVDELAVELCIEHGKKEMLDELRESARHSKMLVKRKNVRKNTLSLDPMFLVSNLGRYSIYTDN